MRILLIFMVAVFVLFACVQHTTVKQSQTTISSDSTSKKQVNPEAKTNIPQDYKVQFSASNPEIALGEKYTAKVWIETSDSTASWDFKLGSMKLETKDGVAIIRYSGNIKGKKKCRVDAYIYSELRQDTVVLPFRFEYAVK